MFIISHLEGTMNRNQLLALEYQGMIQILQNKGINTRYFEDLLKKLNEETVEIPE